MLGILLQIVLLAALMYALARHEADISWAKLFMVFIPLIIGTSILSAVIGPLAFLVYFVGMIVALKLWFYLDWGKASLISVVHVVLSVMISMGLAALLS